MRLEVYEKPRVREERIQEFFHIARAGFSAPRKQIKNSLAQGLRIKLPEAAEILYKAGISSERRPQTLSFDDWACLTDAFIKVKEKVAEDENKSTG